MWVQSHKGILGNEIADRAAKTGAKIKPTIHLNQSKESIEEAINNIAYDQWNTRWHNPQSCRQTKLFFPSIDRGKSKKVMKLNKHNLGALVRNVTGHAHLDWHRKKIGEYAVNDDIDQEFLDHINGRSPRRVTKPKLCTLILFNC